MANKEFTISLNKTKVSVKVNEKQEKDAVKYVQDRMLYTKNSDLFDEKINLIIYKISDFNELITYLLIDL